MLDLWFAAAAMTAAVIVTGLIAARWGERAEPHQRIAVIAFATFGMFAFLFYSAGRLYWASLIPDSAVIIWSNLTPLFAGLAAGLCWRLADTPRWRRALMTFALSISALAAVLWPFIGIVLRPPPIGGNVWNEGVAMQTAWATCSPAAAATFLHWTGIRASESEMVPLCLTDASGTPTLGLYRGVKVVANRNGREVRAERMSHEQLEKFDRWPVLLMVKLPVGGIQDPRYESEWGWVPGLGHTVVALGRTDDGGYLIGDPAIGLERWNREDLQVLWHGDAITQRRIQSAASASTETPEHRNPRAPKPQSTETPEHRNPRAPKPQSSMAPRHRKHERNSLASSVALRMVQIGGPSANHRPVYI